MVPHYNLEWLGPARFANWLEGAGCRLQWRAESSKMVSLRLGGSWLSIFHGQPILETALSDSLWKIGMGLGEWPQ